MSFVSPADLTLWLDQGYPRFLAVVEEVHATVWWIVDITDPASPQLLREDKGGTPSWGSILPSLRASITQHFGERARLVLPDARHLGKLLYCRLGAAPQDADWGRAIVLGRERPDPGYPYSSFNINDLVRAQTVIDEYPDLKEAPSEELRGINRMRMGLAKALGPDVELTVGSGAVIVGKISTKRESERLSGRLAGQSLIQVFGDAVYNRLYLDLARTLPPPLGPVDEFAIHICGDGFLYAVEGCRVCVRQSPQGTQARVEIPQGWWWTAAIGSTEISEDQSVTFAREAEQRDHPEGDGPAGDPLFLRTVLLPDIPFVVAHVVRVFAADGRAYIYYINGNSGAVLRREPTSRDEHRRSPYGDRP